MIPLAKNKSVTFTMDTRLDSTDGADSPDERLVRPKKRYGICFLPHFVTIRRDEKLYLEYTESQKQRAVPRFLIAGMLLQVYTAIVPGEVDYSVAYSLTATASIVNITLLALHYFVPSKRTYISHLAWFVLWAQLLATAGRRKGDAFAELLGWAVLFQYLTLATLPFRGFMLFIYSVLSFGAYIVVQYVNYMVTFNKPRIGKKFVNQELSNSSILLSASLLGALAFIFNESQHRRSFIETKRSLRDKLTIDQQSKEQERLLLSVLPEHVAVQMRKDLGQIDTQFKKIYMSRHENVSILYADIVGFTAISSTYSAQDLVAILNELFARFDRLSEKYQQLRIKILGDCYYCISGAPVERSDHAVLCVHMGLSMVKAIKYVQQTTNSPVDMRVGIHTGAVLAGVLGQRQWQFDVYSRDVELANKMESSGMAGRVHISEVTLGFLNDEFEVEPAFGEKREEMLRQAGIKTYFIVKVLKSYHGDEKSGEGGDNDQGDTLSDLRDEDEASILSGENDQKASEVMLIHNMLEEELRNRDDVKELASTGLCLGFESAEERRYWKRSDHSMAAVMAPPVLLHIPILIVGLLIPVTDAYFFQMACIIVFHTIYYCTEKWRIYRRKPFWRFHRDFFFLINHWTFMSVVVLNLINCGLYEQQAKNEAALSQDEEPIQYIWYYRCSSPSYYYHITVCGFCSVMFVSPASCIKRILLLVGSCLALLAIQIFTPRDQPTRAHLDLDPYKGLANDTLAFEMDRIFDMQFFHRYRHTIMVIFVAFCLCIFDRYLEALQRARHLRGERMRKQAEQASDLRRRNQALVYNLLPPHVARHFMGAHRNHRDLYSQSYAEVGVLFASMPNFTEFYSEETVNNQGLECLRFLNEVISDFDLLLEEPRFRDIIKIKTISSTYMAASGLNPKQNFKNADSTATRWNHLMCLVEFALELQRVLAAINEQSFNHFVLRMGVNNGPITAGVIGAKKPHYDIWGNTVNVASRMESTGKAGCIQVTEETRQILKNFGYYFEQRGLVAVKGKGNLMTYYLQGRNENTEESQPPPDSGSNEPARMMESHLVPVKNDLNNMTVMFQPGIISEIKLILDSEEIDESESAMATTNAIFDNVPRETP